MKKHLLLSFFFLLTAVGTLGVKADDVLVNGIYYTLSPADKTASATSCGVLENLVIPDEITVEGITYAVTSIADYAFSNLQFSTVSIGKNVEYIGESAFYGAKFTKMTFAEDSKLVKLDNYSMGVTAGEIALPYGLEYIGFGSFVYVELNRLRIPVTVTEIDFEAFMHCDIKDLYVKWTVPIDGDFAYGFNDDITVHVPRGTYWVYKNHPFWGQYKIVESYLRGDVNYDGKVDVSDVTCLVGIILGSNPVVPPADVNEDEDVDVSDVTELVSIILNGSWEEE